MKELIRKQDAVKILDELLEQMTEGGCLTVIGDERIRELKEDLEKLPAVQPEPPWIPCSKKLPDYGYEVLVSIYDWVGVAYRVAPMPGSDETKDGWMDSNQEMNEPEDVYAWMPFPHPYKGEENG